MFIFMCVCVCVREDESVCVNILKGRKQYIQIFTRLSLINIAYYYYYYIVLVRMYVFNVYIQPLTIEGAEEAMAITNELMMNPTTHTNLYALLCVIRIYKDYIKFI